MFNRLFNYETRADKAKAAFIWLFLVAPAISAYVALFFQFVFLWRLSEGVAVWFLYFGPAVQFLLVIWCIQAGFGLGAAELFQKYRNVAPAQIPAQAQEARRPVSVLYHPSDPEGTSVNVEQQLTLGQVKSRMLASPPKNKGERKMYAEKVKPFGKDAVGWVFTTFGDHTLNKLARLQAGDTVNFNK